MGKSWAYVHWNSEFWASHFCGKLSYNKKNRVGKRKEGENPCTGRTTVTVWSEWFTLTAYTTQIALIIVEFPAVFFIGYIQPLMAQNFFFSHLIVRAIKSYLNYMKGDYFRIFKICIALGEKHTTFKVKCEILPFNY